MSKTHPVSDDLRYATCIYCGGLVSVGAVHKNEVSERVGCALCDAARCTSAPVPWDKSFETDYRGGSAESDRRFGRFDLCNFYEPDWGIASVTKRRWLAAQSFESN
eukprot:4082337-Prymnesium_polylepis.3